MNRRRNNITFVWLTLIALINVGVFALDRVADLGSLTLSVGAVPAAAMLLRRRPLNAVVVGLLAGVAGLAVLGILDAGLLPEVRI